MILPILSSSPSLSFIKMGFPYMETKSSSLTIWNSSNFSCQTQCKASFNVANDNQKIVRRSSNFKPTIWTNDYIQSLNSEFKEEIYAEQVRVLREEVRMMFCKQENEIDELEFIDILQRLGIDYHFKNEIRNILDNIYKRQEFNVMKSLYAKALKFRLLRQHGYNISIDCFDEMDKFKESSYAEVDGMLSLYEASFHSFENEIILDEARDFTSKFLKNYLSKNRGDYHTSLLISHTLELPLHWRIPRWEAEWYINVYKTKQNMNPILLQFAKLDFNVVQSIYQEELKYVSSWWKTSCLGSKLSFARDRLVENFVWTVGTNFKPDFDRFRKSITKVNALVTTVDDVYDTYGTLEELELFTEAIDRWDLNAIDSLPDYMKVYFHALYNFVDEMAFETLEKSGYDITSYLKKAWTDLCKSYWNEAKWYHHRYIPSLGEYIENAWISISTPVILTHAYFLVPHTFKMEDLVHFEESSNLIRFSAMILRLANDLGTYKRENETGDIPKSIQCYMNETGASEEEACEYVKSMMCIVWKKMNKEAHCSSFSQSFVDTAVNLARMALCMYQHGDGHTIQCPQIKNRIVSLIFQPIPVISTHNISI